VNNIQTQVGVVLGCLGVGEKTLSLPNSSGPGNREASTPQVSTTFLLKQMKYNILSLSFEDISRKRHLPSFESTRKILLST
jgi:hypothetical protein